MSTWRWVEVTARTGRARRWRCLTPKLTTAEVTPIEARPTAAARRPRRPPTVARPPATASHSTELLAAVERSRSPRSNDGVSCPATAW